jgi:hypothetical protein
MIKFLKNLFRKNKETKVLKKKLKKLDKLKNKDPFIYK